MIKINSQATTKSQSWRTLSMILKARFLHFRFSASMPAMVGSATSKCLHAPCGATSTRSVAPTSPGPTSTRTPSGASQERPRSWRSTCLTWTFGGGRLLSRSWQSSLIQKSSLRANGLLTEREKNRVIMMPRSNPIEKFLVDNFYWLIEVTRGFFWIKAFSVIFSYTNNFFYRIGSRSCVMRRHEALGATGFVDGLTKSSNAKSSNERSITSK